MKKLTVYLRASHVHSWEEGYDENMPFDIKPSLEDHNGEWSWVVGSFEVDIPEMGFTVQQITEYQLMTMEQVLEKYRETSLREKMRMQSKIDDLRCLPAPGDLV